MDKLDLAKIRKALDKETDYEAGQSLERVLLEMGYYLAVPNRKG